MYTPATTPERRSVLGRMFDILDCFGPDSPEQTVSGLCLGTGLPPATVHRMLASLVELQAVERTSRGRYRLGRRLWHLGHWVPEVRQLRDVARPHLVDLFSTSGAPVMLAGRQGERVVLYDSIGGRRHQGVWPYSETLALVEHAAGLVILAGMPVADSAAAQGLDLQLLKQLAEIRRQGFAVSHSSRAVPLTWVASGVAAPDKSVNHAVVVAVPGGQPVGQPLVHLVRTTARSISVELARAADRADSAQWGVSS